MALHPYLSTFAYLRISPVFIQVQHLRLQAEALDIIELPDGIEPSTRRYKGLVLPTKLRKLVFLIVFPDTESDYIY